MQRVDADQVEPEVFGKARMAAEALGQDVAGERGARGGVRAGVADAALAEVAAVEADRDLQRRPAGPSLSRR